MGSYVTSTGWTERFRLVRRLVSFQSDIPGPSDRSTRWLADTVAGSAEHTHQSGIQRAANVHLYQREIRRHQLAVLGLAETATSEDIANAYHRLVSDLTPGPDANHARVELALAMLEEVDQAYRWLKMSAVA